MRPLFKGHSLALAMPWDIAKECDLDLDFRKVRFPGYPVPEGETPFSFLYKLCFEGVRERYLPITLAVTQRLQRELEVIEKTGLAEFFLINRSEEHTSELQSHLNLVCRLLLEKKKKIMQLDH